MPIKPSATEKIARAKKTALRFAIVMLIVVNTLVVLPGAVFSVVLGQYTPTVTAIVLSLIVWAAGYGVVRLVRAHRETKRAEDTDPAAG